MRSPIVIPVVVIGLLLSLTAGLATQEPARLPRSVTDPGVITTRQAITPAGVQTVFDGRVFGLTFGATNDELWVLTRANRGGGADLYRLDWLQNRTQNRWSLAGAPALQGLALDPIRQQPGWRRRSDPDTGRSALRPARGRSRTLSERRAGRRGR
jgi:hypothetical protein